MGNAKKNELKPHLKKYWCIPPEKNGEFVARMEDVLDLYQEPHDFDYPVICMDETSKQLTSEVRRSIPVQAGQPKRIDFEYERNGVANIFMFTEALTGWRRASVTKRRTKIDWAHEIKHLLEVDYPKVIKVRLVMDNLNTHTPGSLYEAFEPKVARRLLERLDFHYTPKHGSWLNMAEIELKALSTQCLNRRIESRKMLTEEVEAWESERNDSSIWIDWQFTTKDARTKLKRLYPIIQS